jgi:hypothetical protein
MAVDLKNDLMVTLKYGAGDTALQYVWYKFVGPKVIQYFGAAGKWADVVGTALYSIVTNAVADEFGSEYGDYLRQGGASTFGRALSNALGDPSIMKTGVPRDAPALANGNSKFSTIAPVRLV